MNALLVIAAAWAGASDVARAETREIEVYETLSGRDLFLEPEPPLVEQDFQGGYVLGACNCAMCVGLRARSSTVQINASTPLAELEAGLREAAIGPADVVYDLGSGDGRAAILAAVEFGARAVGLDQRPEAVELARANARRSGVEERTRFYVVDDARADLSAATVVYVYRRPLELGPIRLRLQRLPRLRLAVSYRHAWPNAPGQRQGEFWLWRTPAAMAPTGSAAHELLQSAHAASSRPTQRPRWRCLGGCCRACR